MDEKLNEVYKLADSGKVMAAIKLYRELTGAGLAESKAYVDSYLAGELGNASKADRMPEIMSLINANRDIEAIKVYREYTGCGLVEAKDAVDKLKAGSSFVTTETKKVTTTPDHNVCPACGCSAVTEKTRKILFISKKYRACMNCGYEIE